MATYLLGIDTETTGITPQDKVLQIAAVLIRADTLETAAVFCTLVDPGIPIHPAASAVHGITEEMLAGQPDIETVWRNSPLLQWVGETDILFGHNVSFDVRMLQQPALAQHRIIDTLNLARVLWPQWAKHKLEHCVQNLQLPPRKAHDALGDIESSADVLRYLKRERGIGLEDAYDLSANMKKHFKAKLKTLR